MFRVSIMSGKAYAKELDSDCVENLLTDESEDIDSLLSDGIPVILVQDISDLENVEAFDGIDVEIV